MAALDFGMALARGMLPKSETAQKDLLNLAGGRNIFKSEDWWNKAVDKQISEGYRTVKEQGLEYLMPTGEYKLGERQQRSYYSSNSVFGGYSYSPAKPYTVSRGSPFYTSPNVSVTYEAPEGSIFTTDPRTKEKKYTTRSVDIYGDRKDYTAGELKDIETAAKRGAEQAKRTVAETKASKRRLSRATGGLMGKARAEGEGPATGLPALGEGGLGITESILGGGIKL